MVNYRFVIRSVKVFVFVACALLLVVSFTDHSNAQGCAPCPVAVPSSVNDLILAPVLDSNVVPESDTIGLSVLFGIANPHCDTADIPPLTPVTYILRLIAVDFTIDPDKTQTYVATPSEQREAYWVMHPNRIGSATFYVEVTALLDTCEIARKTLKLSLISTNDIGVDARGVEIGNLLIVLIGSGVATAIWGVIKFLGIDRIRSWFGKMKTAAPNKTGAKQRGGAKNHNPKHIRQEKRPISQSKDKDNIRSNP
jgi:hypothetical protein